MIDRVANALNMAMKLHKPQATILLENTAGEKGRGYTFEQVSDVISRLSNTDKIGSAIYLPRFAAGYDIRTKGGSTLLRRRSTVR